VYRLNSVAGRLETEIGRPVDEAVGGQCALVAQDTKSLFLNSQTRGEARALACAVLLGAGLGVAVGGAYFTSSAVAQVSSPGSPDARAERLAPGVSAAALRHDPVSAVDGAERERQAAVAAAAAIALRHSAAQPFRSAGVLESSRDLDCLSAAVYYEARGETAAGQAAVAQVVLNRVRNPAFPRTVCGVVYQGASSRACQFSFVCDGSMRRSREPAAWSRARDIAARALGGFVMTQVGTAVNFHVARMGSPWGAGMVRVSQVGGHVFYRMSGHAGRLLRGGTYAVDNDRDHAAVVAARPEPVDVATPAGEPTVRMAVALIPVDDNGADDAAPSKADLASPRPPAVKTSQDTAKSVSTGPAAAAAS